MPVSNAIAMNFANDGRLGRKLGQVSAANTAAMVFGSAFLFILFKFIKVSYTVTFTLGAAAFLGASVLLMFMKPNKPLQTKKRFVFRKEYRLFYILSVLYGARKQIFITFGPWVLIEVFKQKVATMTLLFFIISVISIAFKPIIGNMIDKIGEKFVLSAEAAMLFFVCFGYSFADDILPSKEAVLLICACYVLDQLLSSASMARSTYLKKIALSEEEVSPTLSLGISIDHVMSMILPVIGGLVWYGSGSNGYKYVFLGGAVIAVLNFFVARHVEPSAKIS
jgi:MFS family permease